MSTTLELLAQIKNKQISTKSELNLRNEDRQVKQKGNFLKYLKKEKDMVAKLIFPAELVFEFNPLTMEPDDEYNRDNRWRLDKSFTSAALALKAFYDTNTEIKEKFLEYVGKEKWDTSDYDVLSPKDLAIFRPFRKPRMFTNDMVKIKLPSLTKQVFACDYLANFKRDKFNTPKTEDGEYPEILRIQRLYRAIAQEEYNEWEKNNAAKSDDDKTTQWSTCMNGCPISPDIPVNTALGFCIEVDNTFSPKKPLKTLTKDELNKSMYLVRLSNELKSLNESVIEKFTTSDINNDFIEIDMSVGDEEDSSERGKNTKYEKASAPLMKRENEDGESLRAEYDVLANSIRESLDTFENLETTMRKATVYNVLDEDVIQSIYVALEVDKPYESIERFLTKEIGEDFGDLLDKVYGGAADGFLADLSLGDAKEGTATKEQIELSESNVTNILKGSEEIGDFNEDISE